ncbi:hypothetical protein M406DRAFT_344394, partial [Cryphonectria parasitica EP155]
MARTRSSQSARAGNLAEAASASSSAAINTPMPLKRPRGRPAKAMTAADTTVNRGSHSSASTSNYSESASGYSTPLTSNVPTPAPEKSTRAGAIEVVIPMIKTRKGTSEAMQKARDFFKGNDSDRKRGFMEIVDSDDELLDTSPSAQGTRYDEKVARQLQEEFDRQAAEALTLDGGQGLFDSDAVEDSDDAVVANSKGKGKAVSALPPRGARTTAKAVVPDSDDDILTESDFDNYEPPAKKQKRTTGKVKGKGKGKGKMPATTFSDEDDEDDVP